MAAASVSAVVISVGAVAPVYAAGNGGHGKANASQAHASAHQSQGRSHANKSSESTSGEDADEAKGQSETEGESQAKAESNKKGEEQTKTSESHRSSSASSSSADEKSGMPASSQGKGHTPVTVCHLLGNGGYHLLTFDQHALRAHLAHGDVYPDSTGACPSAPSSSATTTTKAHGHTPVTVCHVLGNGGYHLLTFDQHALKAHLAHGDVYPTDGTCPVPESTTEGSSTTTGTEVTETTTTSTSSKTETSEAASSVATELSTVPTRILGVQAARGPRVLGVEAFRAGTATTAAGTTPSAQIAPAAGLLPNTGAARIGLPLVAGFGLLAAGVGLLLRRRGATRG